MGVPCSQASVQLPSSPGLSRAIGQSCKVRLSAHVTAACFTLTTPFACIFAGAKKYSGDTCEAAGGERCSGQAVGFAGAAPTARLVRGRELVLRSGARLCGAKLLREHFTRQRCKMANVVGMLFAYLLLLMWYQYVPVTPPTVYITAIQMAPLGERFFKSS